MRRGLLVLLAPLIFSASAVAQQEVVFPDKARIAFQVTVLARNPDEVVARLLSFDRDHDGKVVEADLVERMQPVIARGDANRDGALDAAEIRTLAMTPVPVAARQGRNGGFPFTSTYGFADDSSFSSRNHIEGAIDDLKLAVDTKEHALTVAKAYVDTLEQRAEADLMKDLEGVLTPQQLAIFQQAVKSQFRTVTNVRSQDGSVVRTVTLRRLNLQPPLNQWLPADQKKQAQQALDRYNARVRMGDAERAELVGELKNILNTEERENLRAALARRPVVANGGVGSAFVDLNGNGEVVGLVHVN